MVAETTLASRAFYHPTDAWYQIEPKGQHLNKAAGLLQIIDDTALTSIATRFAREAGVPGFPGMLIDHDHFKHDLKQESRAFGWLDSVKARQDGLYGQIRWTGTGKAAVDSGDYRFFSTEYDLVDLEPLGIIGNMRRVRPLRLSGLTVTNDPNNRGGKPITNRAAELPLGPPLTGADSSVSGILNSLLDRRTREIQSDYRLTLGPALHEAHCEFAALSSLVYQSPRSNITRRIVLNRGTNSYEIEKISSAEAEGIYRASVASVKARMQADLDRVLDVNRWVVTPGMGPTDLYNFASEAMARMMVSGLSFAEVWDRIEREQPRFLTTVVISQVY